MLFNPASKLNLQFIGTLGQINHIIYILCIIGFIVWGYNNGIMNGRSDCGKNRKLVFIAAVLLLIGIAALIKVNVMQVITMNL